jgi:hypothetical protein
MDDSTLSNFISIEADVLRLHATNPGTHYSRIVTLLRAAGNTGFAVEATDLRDRLYPFEAGQPLGSSSQVRGRSARARRSWSSPQ